MSSRWFLLPAKLRVQTVTEINLSCGLKAARFNLFSLILNVEHRCESLKNRFTVRLRNFLIYVTQSKHEAAVWMNRNTLDLAGLSCMNQMFVTWGQKT